MALLPMLGSGVGTKGAGGPGILQMFGNVAAATPLLPFVTGVFGAFTEIVPTLCLHALEDCCTAETVCRAGADEGARSARVPAPPGLDGQHAAENARRGAHA